MEIPWRALQPDTLEALLEEIVTRDGTDYGEQEVPLAERILTARRALQQGDAVLTWDTETQTSNLQPCHPKRPSYTSE